jgi:hypothetical protein
MSSYAALAGTLSVFFNPCRTASRCVDFSLSVKLLHSATAWRTWTHRSWWLYLTHGGHCVPTASTSCLGFDVHQLHWNLPLVFSLSPLLASSALHSSRQTGSNSKLDWGLSGMLPYIVSQLTAGVTLFQIVPQLLWTISLLGICVFYEVT